MAPNDNRIPVLVNGSAGSASGGADDLARLLEQAGVAAQVRELPPGELADAITRALRGGASTIAVAGGDGSLSTAAGILAGTDVTLAPIPLGTLNHFARRLGLVDVETAVAALASGRTLRLPVGRVGGRAFINNASCGLYPHLVRHRERMRGWMGKWPAAFVAGVQVLLGLRSVRLTLETPEATLQRKVPALWVGLGHGSFELPGDAAVKDDARALELVLPHAHGRAGLLGLALRVLWRLARGRRARTDGLEILHAPAVMLEARHPIDIALDGEPLRLSAPLQFVIEPEALQVIAGPDAGTT
ncbi:MAG TPA: diacylglycerol kinase family protein [Longimicrobiales bacterium]